MNDVKILKAYCDKTKRCYGLEVKKFGSEWKVVNMVDLNRNEYDLLMSQVVRAQFTTNDTLQACSKCGNRKIGGCACPPKSHACSAGMPYEFNCVYCKEFKIDYSFPIRGSKSGESLTLGQSRDISIVNFSNVKWNKYDNIAFHSPAPMYKEPRVHIVAEQNNIEFHGYNISEMDEGVYYDIGRDDDFGIECDVDTTTIKPHPGGQFYLKFGPITAEVNQNGGTFTINGSRVAKVGSRFKMQLLLTEGGHYSVFINGALSGDVIIQNVGNVRITFGFKHGSHHCELLSHAYLRGIKMFHSTYAAGQRY